MSNNNIFLLNLMVINILYNYINSALRCQNKFTFTINSFVGITMSNQEIRQLEMDLNSYKREKELLEQQFNQKRRQILDQMRTMESSVDTARSMMMAMTDLTNEYRWESARINTKIQDVQYSLLNKL
jgi:hypothetical protein